MHSFRSIIEATEKCPGVGAFDHLEWTYDGACEQRFWTAFQPREWGIFQKFSKNSNTRGVAQGGGGGAVMFKLWFDWYIILEAQQAGFTHME